MVKLDTKGHTLLLPYLINMGPRWFRRAVVELMPSDTVQKLKDVIDVFEKTSKHVVQQKQASIASNEAEVLGDGKDILSILRMFYSSTIQPYFCMIFLPL